MPLGPQIKARRVDADPIYSTGQRALRQTFTRSNQLGKANSWGEALAALNRQKPYKIGNKITRNVRDEVRAIEGWHLLRFQHLNARFTKQKGKQARVYDLKRLTPAEIDARTKRVVGYMGRTPTVFHENLAKRLRKLEGKPFSKAKLKQAIADSQRVTRNRMRLIADNEALTFVGDLNKRRQKAVGVEQYEWQTVGDNRVRPTHANNDGETFSWSDPPSTGHPGHEPRCRCSALPLY